MIRDVDAVPWSVPLPFVPDPTTKLGCCHHDHVVCSAGRVNDSEESGQCLVELQHHVIVAVCLVLVRVEVTPAVHEDHRRGQPARSPIEQPTACRRPARPDAPFVPPSFRCCPPSLRTRRSDPCWSRRRLLRPAHLWPGSRTQWFPELAPAILVSRYQREQSLPKLLSARRCCLSTVQSATGRSNPVSKP